MKAAWIGVDVGGTSIKLGAITPAGERLGEAQMHLPDEPVAQQVMADLASAIKTLMAEANCTALGIGAGLPGLLDRQAGLVQHSPNLLWLQQCDLRAQLAASLGIDPARILIENDANVAAMGEQWLGAAQGERNVLTVTLGTGIGGGLILGNELFLCEGQAGEIGHLTVDPEGPACGCGSRGCLETMASASATERRARALGLTDDLPELCRLARLAAGPERELLAAVGRDLGHGLASVVCLLDVRCFVIAGGFSAAFDLLESGIRRGLTEWCYGERVAAIRLLRATLGSSAGWIGAARLLAPPHPPTPPVSP
jgi:glucokinase